MTILDRLAASNSKRLEETARMSDASTNTYIGQAVTDSDGGSVQVILSDDAITPDWSGEGTAVTVPTTTAVHAGDNVLVQTFGGHVMTSPVVTGVVGRGDELQEIAEGAEAVANAVSQHFWSDTDGAHVTEVTQDEWNDAGGASYHSGANSLWNSLGMLFRDGLTNLMAILPSGVAFYDGLGNAASNIVANFGSSLVRIGKTNELHVEMDNTGFRVTNGTDIPINAFVSGGTGIINGDNMELTDSLTVSGTGQFISGILAGTTADSEYIKHIRWGTGNAVTNGNGITTFSPGMSVKPSTVVVVMQHNAETEAIAKIAVPMIWSIDSATQVQVRWKRTDTNAWLTGNRVCWTWLAIA